MATENRKAQLGVTVDPTDAKAGFAEVKAAGKDMAQSVVQEGRKAAEGARAVGDGAQVGAARVDQAAKSMIASVQRSTAALQAGGKSTADYYEVLARQRGVSSDVLRPYIEQLRDAERAQAAATAGMGKMGMSANATAAAMRMVPAQFTDIVVSLQGGQAPMTVLLQQGGQLKDMFGGLGPAVRALGGYVMGLVNPFTLAAAAAGILGLAYYKGSQEADAYVKALVMSGNAAGATSSQLAAMAVNVSRVTGTQSQAADVLAQLATTGEVASQNLEQVARVAIDLEKRAGIPVANTVKAFEELGRAPVDASLKLNEQYRYLTAEVYRQIKALQDQGRETDAVAVAQKAYADAMSGRTQQLTANLGAIERGWQAIKSAAKGAWDAMLNVGRAESLASQIAKAEAELAQAQRAVGGFESNAGGAAFGRGAASADAARKKAAEAAAQLDSLREQLRLQGRSADMQAEQVRRQEAGVKWEQQGEKLLDDKLKKQRDMNRELERATQLYLQQGQGRAAGDKALQDRLSQIRASFAEKDKKGGSGVGLRSADRRLDLSGLQNDMREELAMVDAQVRALDIRRQAGSISEAEYFAKRRLLIEQGIEIERKALTETVSRLEQEKLKGKEQVDVQRQIGDAKSKLALAEINSQNKLAAADNEATQAAQRRTAALEQLNATHSRYIESIRLRAQREVEAVGLSNRERGFRSGLDGINDRYLGEQRRLEDQKLFTKLSPDEEAAVNRRLAQLKVELSEEVKVFQESYGEIAEAQTKWEIGAKVSLKNYIDGVANVAQQTNDLFTKAFQGAEDALVSMVTTGKADVKSLVRSVLADLARMEIRRNLTGPAAQGLNGAIGGSSSGGLWSGLASAIGGVFSGLFGGTRASGGSVSAGKLYQVNERGPELLNVGNRQLLMMGSQGGSVTPNHQLGGNIIQNINMTVGDVPDRASIRREIQMATRQSAAALQRSRSYGGVAS